MDGVEEYHATWKKSIPKNQRLNDFSDKWIVIHNAVWRGGKNKGRMDSIEENERWERGGGKKNLIQWIKHHYPMYMYDYANVTTSCTTRETKVVLHLCKMCK